MLSIVLPLVNIIFILSVLLRNALLFRTVHIFLLLSRMSRTVCIEVVLG